MLKHFVVIAMIVMLSMVCSADWKSEIRRGLPVSFSVHVTDEDGCGVSNAVCSAYSHIYGKSVVETRATTDNNGYARIKACASYGEITFNTKASGYYGDCGRRCAFMPKLDGNELMTAMEEAVKRGGWLPENEEFEVVLKRKCNPMPLSRRQVAIPVEPVSERKIWIDLEREAITNVAPMSSGGSFVEVTVSYSLVPSESYAITADYTITITKAGDGGGFAFVPDDAFSEYKFPMKAPKDGYTNQVEISESIVRNRSTVGKQLSGYAIMKDVLNDGKNIYAIFNDITFSIGGKKEEHRNAVLRIKYFIFPPQTENDLEFKEINEATYRYYKERGMFEESGRQK